MVRSKVDLEAAVRAVFEAHGVEECDAAADVPEAREAVKRAKKLATPDYLQMLAAISYDDVPLWEGAWVLLGLDLDKRNCRGPWAKLAALGIARSKDGKASLFLDAAGELGVPGAYYVTATRGELRLGTARVVRVAADAESLLRLLASTTRPPAFAR